MSSSSAHVRAAKKRDYRLGRRAEKQAQTRQRIVEAALDLHSTLGPARTTVSQIAERAGVQRHTYYAHFAEERDLLLACSNLALERDPLPDPGRVRALPTGPVRVRNGLEEFYGWYERNARQAACVLRDAEDHSLTREIVELRMGPVFRQAGDVLGQGLKPRSRAVLGLALDFACWRNLAQSMNSAEAAELMSDAIAKI
jgi:AcrR family transcriptional regulator